MPSNSNMEKGNGEMVLFQLAWPCDITSPQMFSWQNEWPNCSIGMAGQILKSKTNSNDLQSFVIHHVSAIQATKVAKVSMWFDGSWSEAVLFSWN